MGPSPFEVAGLPAHSVVLAVGVGGVRKVLPLPRGPRSAPNGTGNDRALVIRPRWWQPGEWVAAATDAATFALAPRLLVGPARLRMRGAKDE